jgi:hypothetical protein
MFLDYNIEDGARYYEQCLTAGESDIKGSII